MTALAVVMIGAGAMLVWAGITDTSLWDAVVTTFTGTTGEPKATGSIAPGVTVGGD